MLHYMQRAGLCGCLLFLMAGSAFAAVPEGVLDHFESLSSFSVKYVRTTSHDPDPNLISTVPPERRSTFVQPEPRTERATESFQYAGGRARYVTEADKGYLDAEARQGRPRIAQMAVVVGPDRGESMAWHHGAKTPAGGVTQREELPILCFADVALGRRLMRSQEFLTKDDLRAMEARVELSGDVVLSWEDKYPTRHTMRFAEKYGFALASYRHEYREPDTYEEITCSDFRRVGEGVFVPYRIDKDTVYRDSHNAIRHPFHSVLEVKSFELSPEENKGDGLRMHWPKGSSVRDRRTNLLTEIDEDGEVITDDQWYQLLKKKEALDRQSLAEARERLQRATTRKSHESDEGK